MSVPADEFELIELPAEFAGLPHAERLRAQSIASMQLEPYAGALSRLSQGAREELLAQATAHYLATTRTSLGQPDTPPYARPGHQVGQSGELGAWAGSEYGATVARTLRPFKVSTRRCGGIAPVPT